VNEHGYRLIKKLSKFIAKTLVSDSISVTTAGFRERKWKKALPYPIEQHCRERLALRTSPTSINSKFQPTSQHRKLLDGYNIDT